MDQAAIRAFLGKYKYVFLILLVGILLMLLPEGGKSTQEAEPQPPAQTEEGECLEERLSHLLSRMEGAGQV